MSADLEEAKVEIKGINILEEALNKNNGKDAIISISQILYGSQKIKCQLDNIFDDKRIGFTVKTGQEIYIYREDIVDFGIEDGIYFADRLMKVNVKLINAV